MIPVLYPNDETLFQSNGLGRLADAISCTVKEERNGVYEAELVYPISGVHYADIQEGCILYCTHDDSGIPQPFDIYARSAVIDGNVTFFAHHISYRLSNVIVRPFSLSSATAASAMNAMKANAINDTPFTFSSDKMTAGSFALTEPDSLKARLGGVQGSILDAFGGGEYEFNKFSVILHTARGVDNGVTIRYGKNLTDITADRSIEGRYTGVVPFWKSSDGDTLVMLPEQYLLTSHMPTEDGYLTEEDDVIIRTELGEPIELTYGVIALDPMDLSSEWEEAPTEAQLRAKAISRYDASNAWETEENIEVNFVALWQTPEYEDVAALQRVRLCDTVTVYYPALGVEVSKKVITTEYNSLLDRYDSIELGMAKTSFADVITERTVDMMSKYASRSFMQTAIDNATALITGGLGGHVVFGYNANGQPEEILIMDTDSVETAVNVIRMNKNGIGFSTTGYQGPFTSAWTINGAFNTDFIAANSIAVSKLSGSIKDSGNTWEINLTDGTMTLGSINADDITAGTITSHSGGNSWNLNTGVFESTDGTRKTQISAGKIRFYKGSDPTGYIEPAAWGNDYATAEGVVFLASSNAKYLGIGHQWYDGSDYWKTSDIVINNGLNPKGYQEKIIFDSSARFAGSITLRGGSTITDNTYDTGTVRIYLNAANGTVAKNAIGAGKDGDGSALNNAIWLYYNSESDTAVLSYSAGAVSRTILECDSGGNVKYSSGEFKGGIKPLVDYQPGGTIITCGNSSFRWYQVWSSSFNFATGVYINYNSTNDYIYASKTIHQASDENLKNVFEYDEKYDALVDELEPILYSWKSNPTKIHAGLGARKTAATVDRLGIEDCGFVGIDHDENGNEIYSVDYQELAVMLLHKYQKENKALKEQVSSLEDRLSKLEKRLEAIGG